MIARVSIVMSSLIVAALACSSLALPARVAAADPPARLQAEAQERDDGTWMLRATLTRGGAVQSQQDVEFFQLVEFFGDRSVPLGTGLTDAAGVATRLYSPTTNGMQQIVARYAGSDGTFESDVLEITVAGVAPVLPGAEQVLPIIQAWAFPVGAAVLILVWLALAVILLRAVIGIARPASAEALDATPIREGPLEPVSQETSSTE